MITDLIIHNLFCHITQNIITRNQLHPVWWSVRAFACSSCNFSIFLPDLAGICFLPLSSSAWVSWPCTHTPFVWEDCRLGSTWCSLLFSPPLAKSTRATWVVRWPYFYFHADCSSSCVYFIFQVLRGWISWAPVFDWNCFCGFLSRLGWIWAGCFHTQAWVFEFPEYCSLSWV